MKPKSQPEKTPGFNARMIHLVLFMVLITLQFNSCQKEDNLQVDTKYTLKSDSEITDNYEVIYGKEQFIRENGQPVNVLRQIGNSNMNEYEDCFILNVQNGVDGQNCVSSAVVKIDGNIVLSPSDFKNSPVTYQVQLCNLTDTSSLEVEIRGTPGSTLVVWIEGKPKTSGTFTDTRDGKVYKWVRICGKVWMAENLAYLPAVSPSADGSNTQPFYYVYDYQGTDTAEAKKTDNFKTYGVLYNWPAAMQGESSSNANPSGVRGISPDGWHIPSDAEWAELEACLGGIDVAGGKMKEVGTAHWIEPNFGATNESGFTGLPAGQRWFTGGGFVETGTTGYWWTSTEKGLVGPYRDSWIRVMYYEKASLCVHEGSYGEQGYGFSVRCVKD